MTTSFLINWFGSLAGGLLVGSLAELNAAKILASQLLEITQ
jgi:predicted lipid-binding transport protein (Tim44 family)